MKLAQVQHCSLGAVACVKCGSLQQHTMPTMIAASMYAMFWPTVLTPYACMQIVAGLEPEHTNTFLQMLGQAARMGPAADAVQVRTAVGMLTAWNTALQPGSSIVVPSSTL
jgi:hypothetical protein